MFGFYAVFDNDNIFVAQKKAHNKTVCTNKNVLTHAFTFSVCVCVSLTSPLVTPSFLISHLNLVFTFCSFFNVIWSGWLTSCAFVR